MSYKVEYSERVVKQLRKLDGGAKKIVLNWIKKNLVNCENPRAKGKGLIADHKGEWRYRIGNYRLLCEIRDNELVILALSIGHRSTIYK